MKIRKRLLYFLRRRQFERDLAEEVRFHREMAGAAFGSAALTLEESREVWGFAWLDSLLQDFRYALRGFRKTPAFALTVIGTIGLGLGLNTTLFTVFNAYVLRPLAVHDPYSLYTFLWTTKNDRFNQRFTWPEYQELCRQNFAFSESLAWQNGMAAMAERGSFVQVVSGNYFTMLGVGMSMGRPILEEDAVPGSPAVAVASYTTWKNRFAADPNILGKKIYLRGVPVEVVGVARPEFLGLDPFPAEFWVPLTLSGVVAGGADLFGPDHPARLIALLRLREDVTPQAARSALLAWARGMTADRPSDRQATGVFLELHATPVTLGQNVVALAPIFVAFGLVLLIACANVSNMMLARALSRQREMGIRVSLGAGRTRLLCQLLTESLLLAIPAAAAGYAIGQSTVQLAKRILLSTSPPEMSRMLNFVDLSPDSRVFGFILVAAVASTLMFGLVPAIQTTRTRLVEANRGDFSSDYRPTRLRNALVVTQVTVCALLLIVTMVVLRSQQRLMALDFGLDTHQVFDLRVADPYLQQAAEQLRGEPFVESLAAMTHAPLNGGLPGILVAGPRGASRLVDYDFVSPEFFNVFRIRLLRGRNFFAAEADVEAPVAIVSESAARTLWPQQEALGQTIVMPGGPGDRRGYRSPTSGNALVIGVARDALNGWLGNGGAPVCLYFPTNSRAPGIRALVLRVKGDPDAGARAIQASLDKLAPSVLDQILVMDHVLAFQSYPFRVTSGIAAFLGGVALLLTVSGIYGVLSYLVSQRTKEIGIRMALGAGSASVVRMVLRQSMRLAAVGTGVGVLLALAVAPLFAHEIEVVNPYEVAAYAGGAMLVMLAALGAAFHPARRAVRIDPIATLRCD